MSNANMKQRTARYHALKDVERRLLVELRKRQTGAGSSEEFEAISRAAGQAGRMATDVLHGRA